MRLSTHIVTRVCLQSIHTCTYIYIDTKHFLSSQILQNCLKIKWNWGSCFIQCTWSWFVTPVFLHPPAWLYASLLVSMHSAACPCLASVVFSLSLPVICDLCIFFPAAGKASLLLKSHVAGLYRPLPQMVTSSTGFCLLTLLEAGSLGYLCHHNKCLRQQIHKISRFLLAQLQKFWSDSLTLLLSAWGGAAPVEAVYSGANLLT